MSDNVDKLHELTSLLCDGDLSAAELAQLESILRSDPAARRFYYELIELHGQLSWANARLRARPPEQTEAALESVLPASEKADSSHARQPAELTPTAGALPLVPIAHAADSPVIGFLGPALNLTMSWLSSPRALALTIVGGLLSYFVALFVSIMLSRAAKVDHRVPAAVSTAPGVARLTGAARCQWSTDTSALGLGANLPAGMLELAAGIAELEFAGGAVVRVEGPAQFDVQSADRLQLKRGALLALAPARAHGFTVSTPRADVVDLGTQFGVHVDEAGVTDVQVFRGAVEVVVTGALDAAVGPDSPASHRKQRFTAGQAARIAEGGAQRVEPQCAAADLFVPELTVSDRLPAPQRSAYAQRVLAQTAPVAYWTFDDGRGKRTQDLIQERRFDSFLPSAAGVAGPRPIDDFAGMAAGNSALAVDGSGTVACRDVDRELQLNVDAYSLQMWFNSSIEFDQQLTHYLLVRGNGWQQQVDRRDSVFIGGGAQETGVVTSHLTFFPGIDADKCVPGASLLRPHQWYQLTFVRRGLHVSVYLNGQVEIDAESPWMGGDGQYLTFGHRVDLVPKLGLHGHFDEVVIWNRALSRQEVAALYDDAVRPPDAATPGNGP